MKHKGKLDIGEIAFILVLVVIVSFLVWKEVKAEINRIESAVTVTVTEKNEHHGGMGGGHHYHLYVEYKGDKYELSGISYKNYDQYNVGNKISACLVQKERYGFHFESLKLGCG